MNTYQAATSCIKTSAFVSHLLSGVLGDVLVTQFDVNIKSLFYISTVFVTIGMIIGLFVIRPVEVIYRADGKVQRSTLTAPIMNTAAHRHDSTDDDYVAPRTSTNSESKAINNASDKWKYIKSQAYQIQKVFQSRFILTFSVWWVVCNAIWMTLYDYEVAIYDELNGNNDWNGSILAIMLVSGFPD